MVSNKPIRYKVNENGCKICVSHNKGNWKNPKITVVGVTKPVVYHLWEKENGKIPVGKMLECKCGEDDCIELGHWELVDGVRGRGMGKGPRHYVDGKEMREILNSSDEKAEDVAKRLGISINMVYKLRRNKPLVSEKVKLTGEELLEMMGSKNRSSLLADKERLAST